MAIGYMGRAKGSIGAWIVLAECEQVNGETFIRDLKCAAVDGEIIKADTWYQLQGGELIEYD
jgi:hypothetical protein